MLNGFLDVLGNAHFEAYIGGPIAGMLVALLFQGFGGGGAQGKDGAQISLPINIYEYRVTFLNGAVGPRNSSDGFGFGALIVVGVLAVFLFVVALPSLVMAIQFLNMATLAFGFFSVVIGALSGRVRSVNWWLLVIFPCVVAFVCFVLIEMAFQAIDPAVINYAKNTFDVNSDQLSRLFLAAWNFFKEIGSDYQRWMIFIIAGVVLIGTCSISVLLRLVHYLALSKIAVGSAISFWTSIALRTRSYGSFKNMALIVIFLVAAYWLVTGGAYLFLR